MHSTVYTYNSASVCMGFECCSGMISITGQRIQWVLKAKLYELNFKRSTYCTVA